MNQARQITTNVAMPHSSNGSASSGPLVRAHEALRAHEPLDIVAAIWRYRWAVILPALLGAVIGFLIYVRMPETYRSSTRLMVESDAAAMLDVVTGEVVGGVPGIEVLESQLFSDEVIKTAFTDADLQAYHDRFPGGLADFTRYIVQEEALTLEPEVTDLKTSQSLVTLMHFDSDSKDFSEIAVKSFSEALQEYYKTKHRSTKGELKRYIETATKRVSPEIRNLEEEYRNFRQTAELAWDSEGKALNPHRERQLFLVERRSELTEKLRQVQTEHAAVKSVMSSTEDPEVALLVVSQLLEKRFSLPGDDDPLRKSTIGDDDEQLALVKVEERLIPLMVQRAKLVNEFGPEHPTVRQLELEVEGLREELSRISLEQANRIKELLDGSGRRRKHSSEAVAAILDGLSAQMAMLQSQIEALNSQVQEERKEATKLAGKEMQHESLLRELEQQRDLMDQLKEQMAKVSVAEEDGGTRVTELKAPSKAYVVSPILIKNLAVGSLLGLVLGGGLAFLLEKNANTFRDPEEISQILATPVLTHVPFFKGRQKRLKKGEENPFQELDPCLAVLHTPSSVASEAIRSLRTSIFFELSGAGGKVIQVTSPLPGDGKSTIVGNLACSIAQSGKRVLTIDCDLRRPQLTDNFAMSDRLGLTDVLNGECEPGDAIHQTPLAHLHVMPSGPIPANPADALTLPDMSELLELLRDRYDYILMDTPPLLVVTDPSITASMADGVVIALRIRRKSKPNAKESVNILRAVGARVLGVVINNSDESSTSDGYRGYGYYRYGRYTNRYYRRNEGSGRSIRTKTSQKRHSKPVVVSGRGLATARKAAPLESQSHGIGSEASSFHETNESTDV